MRKFLQRFFLLFKKIAVTSLICLFSARRWCASIFFPLCVVAGLHARFEHEVSTNVFLTPAAGDPRQRSTKQKLELKNVAGLNFGAFFVLSAKHIRVCYPCTKHICVCIVFPIFYWQTHTRLLSIDQTHTRLLISIFLPNTTHTHSTHTLRTHTRLFP